MDRHGPLLPHHLHAHDHGGPPREQPCQQRRHEPQRRSTGHGAGRSSSAGSNGGRAKGLHASRGACRLEVDASALVGEDGVPGIWADASFELPRGADPEGSAWSIIPIREIPLRQRKGHLGRCVRLQEPLRETLEHPFRLAVGVARGFRREGEVHLGHLVTSTRAGVRNREVDLRTGALLPCIGGRVLHQSGAVGEQGEAEGV
mmetsp:Transcript_115064/g.310894  ORF Transcript_115064/g.310894 Transcript_115064/m.310894 type:complete len:203 (+) Transcript_115064:214-822(+)